MHKAISVSSLILVIGVSGVQAQNSGEPVVTEDKLGSTSGGVLEEVIVTANKVDQSLQKVSVSVGVVLGESLEQLGSNQLNDAMKSIPGVRVTDAGTGPEVNIRGVGPSYPTRFGGDSGTSTLFDGIYDANVFQSPGFYDVERIELLRGPQGTLYGRNAEGGVLNIITNKPTQDFGGNVSATLGTYNLRKFSGVINVPINDQFAVRVASASVKRDGYIKNGLNDDDGWGARVKALYTPTENTSVLGAFEYSHNGAKGPGAVDPFETAPSASVAYLPKQVAVTSGGVTRVYRLPADQSASQNGIRAYLQLDHDFSFGRLTVLPSYQSLDGVKGKRFAGLNLTTQTGRGSINQQSIEVRLASKPESPIKWIAGLYGYQLHDTPNDFYTNTLDFATGEIVVAPISYAMPNDYNKKYARSTGEFLQVTVPINDQLRLIGGVRGSQDYKRRLNYSTALLNDGQGQTTVAHFNNVSWKASVEYDVTQASMLYATIATGYRPGGIRGSGNFSPPTSTAQSLTGTVARNAEGFYIFPANYPSPTFQVFGSETLTAYEFGSKNRFFGGALTVNGSAFYYDYRNYQIPNLTSNFFTLPNGSQILVSSLEILAAKKVVNWGGELEATYLITEDDRLGLSVANLNSDIKTSTVVNGFDLQGHPIENAPQWTMGFNYAHTFHVAKSTLTPSIDVRYSGSYDVGVPGAYAGVATVNSLPARTATQAQSYNLQKAWTKTDLSLAYEPDHANWTITAWAKNITNEVVKTGWVQSNLLLADPRTYGATVTKHF